MPTVAPSAASASARLTAVVLLPTPPLPDATAMMLRTFGIVFAPRWTTCATIFDVTSTLTFATPGDRAQRRDHRAADRIDLARRRIAEFDVERH